MTPSPKSWLKLTYCLLIAESLYNFPFAIIELFSLALTVEALQGNMYQDSVLSGEVGQFEPRFQGEGVVLGNSFWSLQN